MKALFEMLAAYNAWANERLYDAAARVADQDYRADRGAFFGSLHGTLNHLLLGDRIWMHRFTGEAPSLDILVFQRQTGVSLVKGQGDVSLQPERRPSSLR